MAKGINIAIGADTRAYAVAVKKGLIDPTEDAADAIADLGREGGRDLEKIEDGMEDARDATDKVRREFSDLAKEIRDTGRRAKTDFGDKVKAAGREASEGVDEVGREAESTSKEMAASFDGSAESIGDAFQELTANAFAGFGPAGAVAGIAAALGIGAVTAELTKQQEEAEETKQALIDMYREAADEGRKYLSEAQILGTAQDILLDPEKMKTYREEAERVGVDVMTYVRAQAGSYEDLGVVIESANEAERARIEEITVAGRRTQASLDGEVVGINKIRDSLLVLTEQHKTNSEAAEAVAVLRADSEKRQRDQIIKTRNTDRERYEAAARKFGINIPPAVIPIQVSTPNIETIVSQLQRRANATRIRVPASVFTRNGVEVF